MSHPPAQYADPSSTHAGTLRLRRRYRLHCRWKVRASGSPGARPGHQCPRPGRRPSNALRKHRLRERGRLFARSPPDRAAARLHLYPSSASERVQPAFAVTGGGLGDSRDRSVVWLPLPSALRWRFGPIEDRRRTVQFVVRTYFHAGVIVTYDRWP